MRKQITAAFSAGIACLVLSLGTGTAYAQETQPADLGNVAKARRVRTATWCSVLEATVALRSSAVPPTRHTNRQDRV
jgi:hypothetical protein